MKKLYVSNLAWSIKDDDLRAAFEPYGTVVKAQVITDRETARSRGFGFVEFETAGAADDAMRAMNERDLNGRKIRVEVAKSRDR